MAGAIAVVSGWCSPARVNPLADICWPFGALVLLACQLWAVAVVKALQGDVQLPVIGGFAERP
jgi:uncharacterized membrane protein